MNERLDAAKQLVVDGDLRGAISALERAVADLKKQKDVEGLRHVLRIANEIEPHASGRDRKALDRAVYAATQNVRFFERASKKPEAAVPQPSVSADLVPAREVTSPASDSVRPSEILPATPLGSLSVRAQRAVEAGLMPDEPINVVIRGAGSAAIIGTDRRAFIYKHGMLAGATFGHKLASFAYENIVGIEVHTGAMSGAVVIHVPGAASVSTSYWQNGKSDPHKAYNAIPIVRPFVSAQQGAAVLRALVANYTSRSYERQPPAPQAPVPSSNPDPAVAPQADLLDTLRKLAELRDAGVLTPEEFEEKKAELLSRL